MERSGYDIKPTEKIKKISLTDSIIERLERMILSYEIPPGERVNETKIATILGVSRGPLREALRQLESKGLVQIETNKGMYVRDLEVDEVKDLYDIRSVLDGLAGEKAAENIQENDYETLEKLINEMAEKVNENDPNAYFRANLEFHMAIVRISRNKNLFAIYESVCKQTSLFRLKALSLPGRLSVSLNIHRKIFNSLKKRNGFETSRLLSAHVLEAKEALVQALNKRSKGY